MTDTKASTAIYPLTVYDGPNGSVALFVGWIVEGILDIDKVESRLHRIVAKWPLLAGRLEKLAVRIYIRLELFSLMLTVPKKWKYNVVVPLGKIPPNHSTFKLTTTESAVPMTQYTKIPQPAVTSPLPRSLFVGPNYPIKADDWVDGDLPLMHWHLTFFRGPGTESEFTCIGLAFPHLLVDGPGFGVMLRRIENEMLDRPWDQPASLKPGINENALQVYIDEVQRDRKSGKLELKVPCPHEFPTITLGGFWFLLQFMAWLIWQSLWHKSETRFIHIPRGAIDKFVVDTNDVVDSSAESRDDLSMVDIVTAWIYKARSVTTFTLVRCPSNNISIQTVYTEEYPGTRTNLVNMDYTRMAPNLDKESYIFNCFTPVQYPVFTVAELHSMSIRDLASSIAHSKSQLSLERSIYTYELLQAASKMKIGGMFPKDTVNSDEAITISNMTQANTVKFDWSGVGGGRTVGCNKGVLVKPEGLVMSNVIVICGNTEDGHLVIQATLGAKRMQALRGGVLKLIENAGTSTK